MINLLTNDPLPPTSAGRWFMSTCKIIMSTCKIIMSTRKIIMSTCKIIMLTCPPKNVNLQNNYDSTQYNYINVWLNYGECQHNHVACWHTKVALRVFTWFIFHVEVVVCHHALVSNNIHIRVSKNAYFCYTCNFFSRSHSKLRFGTHNWIITFVILD